MGGTPVIWLVAAVGVAVFILLLVVTVRLHDKPVQGGAADDVDPLFVTGIAVSGTGAPLAVTLGAFSYALMAAGLIVMAIGASRTRHSRE